jgi:hypothetical protein
MENMFSNNSTFCEQTLRQGGHGGDHQLCAASRAPVGTRSRASAGIGFDSGLEHGTERRGARAHELG